MHRFSPRLAASLAVALGAWACAERRPNAESSPIQLATAPSASASVVLPPAASSVASAPPVAAPSPAEPTPVPSASVAGGAAPSPAPSGSADTAPALPALLDADGKALPQTEERPRVDSAAFKQRIELLASAIAHDDPGLARSAFFPVVAYEQVKAVAKPARDWQFRLMRAFESDVHEYHKDLGKNAEQARLAGIDVPEPSARWMKPGSEGNRLGYFRVLRSRLRMTRADGKERSFEVTSMISWRGEWYVVHLNGFD